MPKVGMQTHHVFLRRKSTEEMNRESLSGKTKDYPIFMAIAKRLARTGVVTTFTNVTMMGG